MRLRDSIGLNLSPFLLRLVLGVIFVYAGSSKFFSEMSYTPEQAGRLAEMGVKIPGGVAAPAPAAPAESASTGEEPTEGVTPTQATQPTTAVSALRYPEGATLRPVYSIALMIDGAAHPGFDDDGNQLKPIWPAEAAKGKWPVWLALAAGVTELVAGILMFAGFFTRIAAFSLACVMAVAMWLTQFGPAIQAGNARLGFLPAHDLFDGMAWQVLMTQFTLFGVALALFLLGAGALSIDAIIFGAPGDRPHRKHKGDSDE